MENCAASCAWRQPRIRPRSRRRRLPVPRCRSTPTAPCRAGSSSFPEGWSMWSFRRRRDLSSVRPEPFDKLRAGSVEGRTGTRVLNDVPKRWCFDRLSTNGSVLLVALLASCGFHLRGETHYTFDTLFL